MLAYLGTIRKAIAALVTSGALMALLPLLGGPFAQQSFDLAIVAIVTGLVTYQVPNAQAK